MKVGDLVEKTEGDLDINEVGIILEVVKNSLGNTIVTVNTNGVVKKWYSKFIKVISK
jgi:hypothetical protein